MANLASEFPDMTQSVIGDVLSTYSNNIENATAALTLIRESQKEDEQRKIDELKLMFMSLPEEVIRKALKESSWSVESAIVPLFSYTEEQKRNEQKELHKKKSEEEKKRKEKEVSEKVQYLVDMFYSLPKDVVQKILEENEGDIESTTVQLLDTVKKEEEKKNREKEEKLKQEQEKQMRELKINVLKEKFPELTEMEVLQVLNSTSWDIRSTSSELLKISMQKKKLMLKNIFKDQSEEAIEVALNRNDWDFKKAYQDLSSELILPKEKKIPSFVEKSIILEQEIERDLTTSTMALVNQEKLRKEEVDNAFLENLEKIIGTQARGGEVPGISPPLSPKQIDAKLLKERPVKDLIEEIPAAVVPEPVKVAEEAKSASSANVVLSVNSVNVDSGNEIRVDWKVVSGATSSWDWVGLFALDKQNKEYITYQWRGKGETEGSVSFTAPKQYGEYEFRYFPSGSYQHLARSPKFFVGPTFQLTSQLDESKKNILVSWSQISGNPYSGAWIGLYEKSEVNNSQYITWEYAGKTNQVSFTAPIKPGEYQARLFPYSYVDVARSNPVCVEGADILLATVTPEGLTVDTDIVSIDPYWESAWLGIYLTAENDNRCWRRYKHLSQRKGQIVFKLPRIHGTYEVRLFANKTYNVVARSNPFQVINQ